MLDQLAAVDFAPLLHQFFTARVAETEPVALELVAVTGAEHTQTSAQRPFSLLFLGPASRWYLPQRIYELEHEHLGTLDVFLVPLGPQAGRMRYEAIFN